ncbi:cell division FtsZ-interacting protein ZapD [Sphingomonas naasensis]|uniref:Ketohydroxyglutarate aldolase n=1 Tax=Sphingomonas naasensis TaxID=1344951 RepID=A0A4V3QWF0_9SPHN|nr:hypothetical protein [Sphingomonas naasensis]NIJ22031.1 cell division FtsZ-interacting protein ZapD [Sphingomonas naasensis]TGX42292.1 hypothetical protein E5A74_10590 [Sphingomonas naasensis]
MSGRKTYKLSVLVTVEEPHRERLDAIEQQLRNAGLEVVDTSELGGIIAGDIEEEKLGSLAAVPGVANVEVDQSYTTEDEDPHS